MASAFELIVRVVQPSRFNFEMAMGAQGQTQTGTPGTSSGRFEADASPGEAPSSSPPPGEAIREALFQFAKLREFAAYYVSVRIDSLRLLVRRLGIAAGMIAVIGVGVLALVVTAVVLLMRGVAGGLAALFPHYPWLGDLIAGVLFLLVPVIAILIGMRVVTRTFRSFTVEKYETRQRQQRQHFGSDVRDSAAAASSSGKPH